MYTCNIFKTSDLKLKKMLLESMTITKTLTEFQTMSFICNNVFIKPPDVFKIYSYEPLHKLCGREAIYILCFPPFPLRHFIK